MMFLPCFVNLPSHQYSDLLLPPAGCTVNYIRQQHTSQVQVTSCCPVNFSVNTTVYKLSVTSALKRTLVKYDSKKASRKF